MESIEQSLFGAMQAFHNIAQAVAFTPYEVALFHGLLHSWNLARRPSVIEQWVNTSCVASGLESKHQLPRARNGLMQKGIIFFDKAGNRGVPRYSFNSLFLLPSPFLLPNKGSKEGSKQGSKGGVNKEVKADSYQVEEEGKEEREKKARPPIAEISDWTDTLPTESARDFHQLFTKISTIHPLWTKRPHPTQIDREAMFANATVLFSITDDDWASLQEYYAVTEFPPAWQTPEAGGVLWRPDGRSRFIQAIGDILTHHDRWVHYKSK